MSDSTSITRAVAALYEKHPYPHYPLLAKPRWQDGYLTSSLFSQTLRQDIAKIRRGNFAPTGGKSEAVTPFISIPESNEVLIAGSGEMLPYIMRHWEPRSLRLGAVDLSGRSLRRARIRLGLTLAKTEFVKTDINVFLNGCHLTGRTFRHVEAFGMLHHLPSPEKTLASLARQIAPGGTLRAMVYNGTCRAWIHKIQDLLRHLELNAAGAAAVKKAQRLVKSLGDSSPYYAHKLRQMGPGILKNQTRFADAFLHPHEVRWSVAKWLKVFSDAEFKINGIFDRFGELDDLPNPLYLPPHPDTLEERAADLRFENNLEVFLEKSGDKNRAEEPPQNATTGPAPIPVEGLLQPPTRLKLMMPPVLWFSFPETEQIAPWTRQKLWVYFLNHLAGKSAIVPEAILRLPRNSLQRLARLGALPVTPEMPDALRILLLEPMASALDPPVIPEMQPLLGSPFELTLRQSFPEKYSPQVLERLLS